MARAPHIWILCTKRPGRARHFFENHACPPNLWLLTTVTGPATGNRIAELLRVQGVTVRGVSLEPMLGPVDLSAHLSGLAWVICGGESGRRARPMEQGWVRDLRDQCVAAGVPFFMKQICANGRPIPRQTFPLDLQRWEVPNARKAR
jgi:protein gp37